MYEILRNRRCPIKDDGSCDKPPIWYVMAAGSAAGIAMWLPVFPIDVVKTYMQVDNLKKPQFRNSGEVVKHVMKTSGWRGFYKGLAPCLARGVPVNAGVFTAFEVTMGLMNRF